MMNRHRIARGAAIGIIFLAMASTAWAAQIIEERRVITRTSDATVVLTRGPLHEAFAEPLVFGNTPTITISQAPPEPIQEIPAAARPRHSGAMWIPGYWAWDEEFDEYIWLSGVWRVPPLGRVWVAGYWSEGDEGHTWVPGFWVSENVKELVYHPTPPEALQRSIPADSPTEESIWIPGVWHYVKGRWLWEPGFWIEPVEDWVWVPSQWVWSPSGHIFVEGYWDYTLELRGLVFAPVRFRQPVYREVRYEYSPQVVVAVEAITTHLFVRPNYRHYYFGDYYEPRYEELGYRPHFHTVGNDAWYSPIFQHMLWRHRDDRERWLVQERESFEYRRRYERARPPRTYDAQLELVREWEPRRRRDMDLRGVIVAQPVTEVINYGRMQQNIEQNIEQTIIDRRTINNITNLQVVQVEPEYRDRYTRLEREMERLGAERRDWERDRRRYFTDGREETREERRTLDLAPVISALQESMAQPRVRAERAVAPAGEAGATAESAAAAVETPVETPPPLPRVVEAAPAPEGVPVATPSAGDGPTIDAQEAEGLREEDAAATPTPEAVGGPEAAPNGPPVPEASPTPARLRIERPEGTPEDEATPTPAAQLTPTPGETPVPETTPTPVERRRERPEQVQGAPTPAPIVTPEETRGLEAAEESATPAALRTPETTPTPPVATPGTPEMTPTPPAETPTPTPTATPAATEGEEGPDDARRSEGDSEAIEQPEATPTPPTATEPTPAASDEPTTPTRRNRNR